ncbi:Os03g0831550 [Oryza sativa Japonica Group]|uniref:Os03g0831550 protein n=1 Tax=Oryza sativa subsp. japonica TaxID=39947 RepID=A0A0P0W5B9_ORYSJ|nr:hypothetical protein EE612_021466 [Oryza sativa]BAS87205.1 Os03g0831550 [Oryza sativa Japonica Group]
MSKQMAQVSRRRLTRVGTVLLPTFSTPYAAGGHRPVHVAIHDHLAVAELIVEPRDHVLEAGVEALDDGVFLVGTRAAAPRGALQREAAHGREAVKVDLAGTERVQLADERVRLGDAPMPRR